MLNFGIITRQCLFFIQSVDKQEGCDIVLAGVMLFLKVTHFAFLGVAGLELTASSHCCVI